MAPPCPCCLGEGGYDERDLNALLAEHLTDEQLARVPDVGDWLECVECEGTGVVTDERAKDIRAAARASIDQFVARMNQSSLRAANPFL
jgi:hypothetical protein